MPDLTPADTLPESPFLTALFACEIGLILLGAVLLLRHATRAGLRLRGEAPARLTPSPYSGLEVLLAAGFAIGGSVLLQLIVSPLAVLWIPPSPEEELGLREIVAGGAFQLGLLAGLAHAWFWHLRPGARFSLRAPVAPAPARAFPEGVSTLGAVKEGALTFVTAMPLVFASGLLWRVILDAFGVGAPPQDIVKFVADSEDWIAIGAMVALAVLVAPVTEELIFRIGLFRWLRGRSARVIALLLPAIPFALLHDSVSAFVPLVVLAVHLTLAYERVGHPLVPIVAHALFNLNSMTLLIAGLEV